MVAIVRIANSIRAFFARNIARCSRKVNLTAYTTYIRPIVKYASPVREPHNKRNTNKIEMVLRRCDRYVTGNFDLTSSVTFMHNSLNWPTLEDKRRQNSLAMMYRILHNQVDINWQSFRTKTQPCTRCHCCRLFAPFCRTMFMPYLFSAMSLPDKIALKNQRIFLSFFLAPAKTRTTLHSIQLMDHPLTPLSGI